MEEETVTALAKRRLSEKGNAMGVPVEALSATVVGVRGRCAELEAFVAKALQIARHADADDCAGIGAPELMAKALPDLDLHHDWRLDVGAAEAIARTCEWFETNYETARK